MGILNELGGFVKDREDDEDEKVVDRKDIEDEIGDETEKNDEDEKEVPKDKPFESPLEDEEGHKNVDIAELMKHYDNIQEVIDAVDIINSGGNYALAFDVERSLRDAKNKMKKLLNDLYKEKE